MKLVRACLLLSAFFGAISAQAQFPSAITHVVVIFQENRTPDNLFQGLCLPPFGTAASCSTTPSPTQYNIQNFYVNSMGMPTPLQPIGLQTDFDLDHSHHGFVNESTHPHVPIVPGCAMSTYDCAPTTWNQFMYVDNRQGLTYNNSYGKGTTHIMDPYLTLATQYGWANYMFQTNQGPSYPAHQFIFGGTSAPTAADDASAIFVAENPLPQGGFAGCLGSDTDYTIKPGGTETKFGGSKGYYPLGLCYDRPTMATLLDAATPTPISWKYYAPTAGSIWTAPNSIKDICKPDAMFAHCTGTEWKDNVILESPTNPAPILKDIAACALPDVSWVIPDGRWSDHANINNALGPSWVAAIVNALGGFDNTCGYWNNTAIVITWDDWGGWFDHQAPMVLSGVQGDYQYGFRVPLIVVSAYTPTGYINNVNPHDFGSILRMIEGIYHLGEGSLNFADARANTDLQEFFSLTSPRSFSGPIVAIQDANFFLKQTGLTAMDPDDE
jgi:phospholipase C